MRRIRSKWIVCEQTGRWAAALRLAFGKLPRRSLAPKLYEVRSLAELNSCWNDSSDIGLVEVRRANLAEVLELLSGPAAPRRRFIALLDESGTGEKDMREVLWEAGALEVVGSPRQLRGLLALCDRLAAATSRETSRASASLSLQQRAWAALPWQDA